MMSEEKATAIWKPLKFRLVYCGMYVIIAIQ